MDINVEELEDKPSLRARNKLNTTYEAAVDTDAKFGLEEWPGQPVQLCDPGEEPDTVSVLPDRRDPGFMDAVLHALYSGIGNIRVLDMSESKLVRSCTSGSI